MLKIVIETDMDFTPKGKRRAQVVQLRGMCGPVRRIRWYVSGCIYRTLDITDANIELSREWVAAQ